MLMGKTRSGISHHAATNPGRGITEREIHLRNGSKLFRQTKPPLLNHRGRLPSRVDFSRSTPAFVVQCLITTLMAARWFHRQTISSSCPRFDANALIRRILECGRVRPASSWKAMNRTMSSASILSVLARVPRLTAKALIWAGGNCRVTIRAASRADHRRHTPPRQQPLPRRLAGVS